jgi:hypothetical protein
MIFFSFSYADNLSLQDHNNKFIPVRPILRKNFANDDQIESSNSHTSNTAIVIPTTPNSSVIQQSSGGGGGASLLNDNFNTIHILTPLSRHTASPMDIGANNPFRNSHHNPPSQQAHSLLSRPNIEDKLTQIQEYIRITEKLIDSVQHEVSNSHFYNS